MLSIAPAYRVVTLPEGLPRYTLGWEAVRWATMYLKHPDGPRAGQRWEYVESQVRFLLWWYALDRQTGRWLFDHGVRRLSKGAGKSPSAGALALTEFCAPVRLDYFDEDAPGGCVGKPVPMPLVQIAATSESQTANTMRVIRAIAVKGSRLVRDFGIDPGKTVMYRPGGGQLEVITSSAAAAEGALPTFCVMDETEHWKLSNGGPDLAQTLARNLAKTASRGIETANAWEPGAGSVAETTFDAWVAQEEGRTRGGSRILYDARIAPPATDLADDESLRAGIAHAYGDCWWVDQETIRNSLLDPRTPVDVGRRFYLNQPTATVDSWVTPQQWGAIADPAQVIADISDGDDIVAFFDGSRRNDATALVACHVETGDVFTVGVWEPDPGDPDREIPAGEVDAAVEAMFDRWNVLGFFADVKEWESFTKVTWPARYRDQLLVWAVPGGKEPQPVAWDMRTHVYDFTMAAEFTEQEITGKAFIHDGDSRTGRHVSNARRNPNRWGISITKESRMSAKKIDAAVCVIGVRMVRRLLLASPEWEKRGKRQRSGKVWGFA